MNVLDGMLSKWITNNSSVKSLEEQSKVISDISKTSGLIPDKGEKAKPKPPAKKKKSNKGKMATPGSHVAGAPGDDITSHPAVDPDLVPAQGAGPGVDPIPQVDRQGSLLGNMGLCGNGGGDAGNNVMNMADALVMQQQQWLWQNMYQPFHNLQNFGMGLQFWEQEAAGQEQTPDPPLIVNAMVGQQPDHVISDDKEEIVEVAQAQAVQLAQRECSETKALLKNQLASVKEGNKV